MKMKPLMLLAIAVACGLVAMVGVQQALNNGKRGGPDPNLVKVFAAVDDIAAGLPISEEMLVAKAIPKGAVPEGAVTDFKQVQDRALKIKAFKGDLIFEAKLCAKGQAGASITIPEGMRAFTIPVTETQAHSGMVQPGDRVDVACSYDIRTSNGPPIKKNRTILEHIQVFAVDNNRDLDKEKVDQKQSVKSLTLLVTPKQCDLLGLMQTAGATNFNFSLRNPNDKPKLSEKKKSIDFFEIDSGAYEALRDMGMEGKQEPKPEKSKNTTLSDLDNFLKNNLFNAANSVAKAAPATKAVPSLPPPKKFWKMTIYDNKGEKVTEEIDLSAQNGETLRWETPVPPAETDPADPSANDSPNQDKLKQSASRREFLKSLAF